MSALHLVDEDQFTTEESARWANLLDTIEKSQQKALTDLFGLQLTPTKSGADGRFEIKGVPPGELVLEVWHEKLGTQTQTLSLAPRGEASVEFSFEMQK